ncbi:MAG: hypothetical protein LC107_10810 [Chitinophagales bacterium]|nr:hypothetical protein [Chitinophagales bacterium]
MFKKTHKLLTIVLVFVLSNGMAQETLEKAEIQAVSGAYETSIQSYKAHLEANPEDYSASLALAELLFTSGSYAAAEHYYSAIPVDVPEYAVMGVQYATMLKKMGRYQEIPVLLAGYIEKFPIQGLAILQGLDHVNAAFEQAPKYDVLAMPANSNTTDFGLTFYHHTAVFSSFREDILMDEVLRDFNASTIGHKTFKYDTEKNRIDYITGLNHKITHLGPISYATTVNRCAYIEGKVGTRLIMDKDFKNASVHIATLNANGEMTSSKPFPYNEMGSSINSLFLSSDGRSLYFASDRAGGYGGFDIYVSHYDKDTWSQPVNLGSEINTPYNEITPYLFENQLYFASDNLMGLGGYDIYMSNYEQGMWTSPMPLERDINSPGDDYFPALNEAGDIYFTSNRLGGLGSNDIYKAMRQEAEETEVIMADIPEAVSLEALAEATQKHTVDENTVLAVSLTEGERKNTAFVLPEFDTDKVGKAYESDELWMDAHRTALDELLPNSEVFFVQLASMTAVKPNYGKYKPLLKYGNIYRMVSSNTVKIRLGYYSDRKEVEDVLAKVKASGFNDAFITFEALNTAQMELMMSSKDDKNFNDAGNFNTTNKDVLEEYRASNRYKVRLASYEDPIWFEVNKVKDLGRVEQWTKGSWTIFILAGYSSYDEAKRVQMQAINRGFKTAEVVVDNGGILERIKQN